MKKKNNKKDLVIRIVLIVIIILLLLQNCTLIMKDKNRKTGNVDVFQIECSDTTCVDLNDGFEVSDKKTVWSSRNVLNIFSNPAYNMDSKIAPEDSNTYEFKIENNTKNPITYDIVFSEENPYNINLLYKLKRGDTYITKDWTSLEKITEDNIDLEVGSKNIYSLEWKWFSSSRDTEVANIREAYSANIDINARTEGKK